MPRIETVFSTDEVLVKHMVLAPAQDVPWHFHTHTSAILGDEADCAKERWRLPLRGLKL